MLVIFLLNHDIYNKNKMRKSDKIQNIKRVNLLIENLNNQGDDLTSKLLSQNDGPVDEFVVISRGVEMAAAGNNPEMVSNAIYDALNIIKGHGELPSNEMPRIGV
jgi:hypothetical protein